MTNWRDGSINFEQRGVEFPDFWSVNAANIVTTKYFRGAVGTDAREWSLRQLIDRVVHTYRAAGESNGYFGSAGAAEVFEHELTWMLLHQVFSFNSPVWFNVGTASPAQVSACQPYDALVSTPSGLVPIGRLVEDDAVGAKVYDAHGITRVLATKYNGLKEVLRVITKAGHTLDVTADHLVWRNSGAGTGRFVPAGELAAGDTVEWHRRILFGESEIRSADVAEAALAGWLQADGFVGQYSGTNRSLTIEAMTVTAAEHAWVTKTLDVVFPDVHRHERTVPTQRSDLDCRRIRLYGTALSDFVTAWDLRTRGLDQQVPERLFTAPLPVVAAYLRSLFQAEGYVSARERSTLVGMDMISKELIQGVQALLSRFGIFARVGRKVEKRTNRRDLWGIRIQNAGDRRIFAEEIGFIDPMKAAKLEASFELPGRGAGSVKLLEIARIESRGEMDVYDIQTDSGEYLSAGGLRVHNCFILSVDDTMDSILNWYREEGLIFKGGSGAGLNLSRIRSSKELLSSGGTASGPVSFMRGADASAGTIKSGGATRRAAKMVVLDVDHPDIEEFVQTKAREEDKIRVLRDAGFDMDLGGHDITSVQYQNANNSVRVSDEFMRGGRGGPHLRPARPLDRRGARDSRRPRLVRQDRPGGVGMRRPGNAVRRHDQRLAHQPRDRPHHRVQPVLSRGPTGRHRQRAGSHRRPGVSRGRRRGFRCIYQRPHVRNGAGESRRCHLTRALHGYRHERDCGAALQRRFAVALHPQSPGMDAQSWLGDRREPGCDRRRQPFNPSRSAADGARVAACRRSRTRPRRTRSSAATE